MKVIETSPREIGLVLWGHCQNLLDDPHSCISEGFFLNIYDICHPCLQLRGCNSKLLFIFPNQSICCGCSKALSQSDGSFEHPSYMFKLLDKRESYSYPLYTGNP